MRRITVRFEGRVQGVGFRFATRELACSFPVTGYVQNLMEGDVQVVVEGREADVDAFLGALRASFACRYVVRERLSVAPPTGEFTGFEIRHG